MGRRGKKPKNRENCPLCGYPEHYPDSCWASPDGPADPRARHAIPIPCHDGDSIHLSKSGRWIIKKRIGER